MPSVILPKYRGYAIHVDGAIQCLRDGAIVQPRTVVDLWVKGRVVSVEHAWLYALAFGAELPVADNAAPASALEQEVALLSRENADLRATLLAAGIV